MRLAVRDERSKDPDAELFRRRRRRRRPTGHGERCAFSHPAQKPESTPTKWVGEKSGESRETRGKHVTRRDAVKMSSSSLLASFRALRASSSPSSVQMMRSRCFSSRAGDDDDDDDDAKGKDVDVVIVGGGPTGVVLRCKLSSFNVQK